MGCVLHDFRAGSNHPTVPLAIEWLRANPQGAVRVIVGPDDICLPCPQWDGSTCKRGFEEMNTGKDKRFLALLEMRDGDALPASKLFKRLMDKADIEFFTSVCAGCSPEACAAAAKGSPPF